MTGRLSVLALVLLVSSARAGAPDERERADGFVATYRRAAPAVVLIRTPTGYGSGVVITSDGKILTNAHVVSDASQHDFERLVLVRRGRIDPTSGRMQLDPTQYSAWVYAVDEAHDVALIALQDPPADLVTLPLAELAPAPGTDVAAIGNAGRGLLWSMKVGVVASVGDLDEASAFRSGSGIDCELAPHDAPEFPCAPADVREVYGLSDIPRGEVIETTCPTFPGDSGGALVTRDGRLIGINAVSDSAGTSMHVSASTLLAFVSHIPTRRLSELVDVDTLGPDLGYRDLDGDGVVDALVSEQDGRRVSTWLDLDESSAATLTPEPRPATYDAEVRIVREATDAVSIFCDSDDDGVFDTLLMHTTTTPGLGRAFELYRKEADGWILQRHVELTHPQWLEGQYVPRRSRARWRAFFAVD